MTPYASIPAAGVIRVRWPHDNVSRHASVAGLLKPAVRIGGMGAKAKKQPTKVQAVFTGILALLLLINTAMAVLVEGRPITVFYGIVVVLDLGLLALSFWLYRRAVKLPPKVD
jgi:hypothetical protein